MNAGYHFILSTHVVPKKNAHRIGRRRGGGLALYRTKEAINSENMLAWEIACQMRDKNREMLTGRIFVQAVFKKTRADCIGLLETILDAMQKIVYKNDRQVVSFEARWETDEVMGERTCQLYVSELGKTQNKPNSAFYFSH